MIVAFTCFVVALASSVVTADLKGVEDEFHVSEEVALLSITMFVMGFGIGNQMIVNPFLISSNDYRTHGICSFE